MTESESVALPLGDAPLFQNFRSFYLRYFIKIFFVWQAFSYTFKNFFLFSPKKIIPFLFSTRTFLYDYKKRRKIMFLSDITDKNIYVNKTSRGICLGVGVSLKTHAVKYLLCASVHTQNAVDFAVGTNAVADVTDVITLSRLRPVYPKNCAKIAIGLPVYSFEGGYLGNLEDVELRDFIVTRLFTDRNEVYPVTSVFACSDAVILRKEQVYPLGQRIPAPILPLVTDKRDSVVTRSVLRTASAKNCLVKLTLSLPPFNHVDL